MTSSVPMLTLNNGVRMPALGPGVFQTPPEVTTAITLENFGRPVPEA